MRYLLFIYLFSSLTGFMFSQNDEDTLLVDDEVKTLLSDDIKITGFGSPFLVLTNLSDQFVYIAGGGGALLFADKFYIGGYGLGMLNDFIAHKGEITEERLEYGHAGIWAGYIFLSKKRIHPELSLLFGWGGLSVKNVSGYINPDKYDAFSCIVPTGQLDIGIAQYFKIGVGISYRKISGLSYSDYSSKDFSGPCAVFSLKIGWF
ncbi:MAG: hypothetical protein ABIJ97_08600 [Bacteroidota bacterium]